MQYFGNFRGIGIPEKKKAKCAFFLSLLTLAALSAIFPISPLFSQEKPASQSKEPRAAAVLNSSTEKLLQLRTIEANIRMETTVDGVEFAARGRYEEQAIRRPELSDFNRCQYRLELYFLMDSALTPGATPNRMTMVCHIADSTNRTEDEVWRYITVEGRKTIGYVKLAELEKAVQNALAAGKPVPCKTINEAWNLGGLAATLRQLERFYDFNASAVSATLDGVALWKLTGSLKEGRLEGLLEKHGGVDKKGRYPDDLPSDIEIYLGQKDGFPYRIAYLNRPSETSTKRTVLSQTSYYDVILNGNAIPATRFPPLKQVELQEAIYNTENQTQTIIKSLGL